MSTGLRIIIAAVALFALVVLSAWVGYIRGTGRRSDDDWPGSGPEERATLEAAPGESDAARQFRDAWQSFYGPQYRLRRLNETAMALAADLRRDHEARMTPPPGAGHIRAGWKPPYELRRESPRVPPAAGWQAVDRALEALAAELDTPDSTFLSRALAIEQLGQAAHKLADSFVDAEPVSAVAVCAFCGRRGDQVRKIISGPFALICDQCVSACVEVLEEQLGDDWRDRFGPE